jgi:hypothetical protein
MTPAHNRGSWLVYFNGIEIPANQVTVSSGVWSVPQATISIPADRVMQRIGVNDRVRCTVFALDPYRHLVDGGSPEFRLMFDGEILNYGYNSTSSGRTITYVAVDMIESLMRIFPFLITSLNTIVKGEMSVDQAKLVTTVNPFAVSHSLFNNGVKSGKRIKRPYDFVRNILDYLLGDVLRANEKSAVIQQWFGPWNERTGFSDRFVPSAFIESLEGPEDSAVFPIFRAAQRSKAVEALADVGDRLGANGSFYQLIQTVFQHVYYEMSMLTTPPVLTVNKETREIVGGADTPVTAATQRVLGSYMTKPQTLFGVPPKFNVLWPSQIQQFSYDENYATQPTRTYLGDPHLFNYMQRKETGSGLNATAMRALTVGYPPIANERLRDRESQPATKANHHNFITPEEYYKGPVYQQLSTPPWFMHLQQRGDDADDQGATNHSRALQLLYAKYEHFRTRAARRNGGVVCTFNPYVLAGHSGMVIDNEHSSNHVMAYYTQVTHTFSTDQMSTSIAFSHAQTLSEYMDTLMDQLVTDGVPVDDLNTMSRGAPEQPIRELRSRFQTLQGAREYYASMFYGDSDTPRAAAFDVFEVFGVQDEGGVVRPLDPIGDFKKAFSLGPVQDPRAQLSLTSNRSTGEPPDFRVRSQYRGLLTDPAAASAYGSRPICTLEQYIDLQGVRGVREGLRGANNTLEGKGAPYYVRISVGTPGPEYPPPTVDREGNPCNPPEVDSTRDWRARLLAYRTRVYTARGGYRA